MHKFLPLAYWIICLLCFSCQREAKDLETKLDHRDWQSDYKQVQGIQQRVVFLTDLLASQEVNTSDFEPWICSQIKELGSNLDKVDTPVLYEFAKALHLSDYSQAAYDIAHTLRAARFSERGSIHSLAALIIASYHVQNNEEDSLNKYLALVESSVAMEQDTFLRASFHNVNAYSHEMAGRFFDAAVNYHEALTMLDQEDSVNIAVMYHNLATLYLNMRILDKAKICADKALKFIDDPEQYYQYLNTFGLINARTGNYQQAENLFQKVIALSSDRGFSALLAQSLANYGNLKRRQGEFDYALDLIRKSDSLCKVIGLDYGLVINQINRAELFYDQGRFGLANDSLESIDTTMAVFRIAGVKIAYHELRYRVFDSLRLPFYANLHYRQHHSQEDAYLGDLTQTAISEWERQRERKAFLKQESDMALALEREANKTYLVLLLFISALFILTSIIFHFRRRALLERESMALENQRLSYDLELRSKELLSKTLHDIKTHNLLRSLKSELETALQNLSQEDTYHFRVLRKDLSAKAQRSFSKEFDQRFHLVYENFQDKLLRQAPDLTPVELRICALVRLNITSKDISVITGRSVGTIENTRIRVRKKLRLGSGDNLQQYLLAL